MTTRDYLKALKKLGLTPYGKATREALGLESRQLARLAIGEIEPTPMLIKLLGALLKLSRRRALIGERLVDGVFNKS